tara:strand:+ start:65 stop:757 length:693 start_codon:yes stop_codon:yes gene_type:complete
MLLKYYQKLDDAISYLFSSVSSEEKLLKSIFKKKKIFYVDIGTNEGGYLDKVSKYCNIKKAVCFEPINSLTEKISKENYEFNIEIINSALSNKSTKKKFYEYQISSQSSFYKQNDLFKSLKSLKKIRNVSTTTFDNFFTKKQKIDFCKIDVQGEELKVLEGMKKNLKTKKINLIKIEISLIERYKNVKPNFFPILKFFNQYKYQLVSISKIKYNNEKILLMDVFFQYIDD